MSQKQWSASSYLKRKQERRESIKPEWITNPETGSEFFLRRVSTMGEMLAGYMPHELTTKAIAAWKEKGVKTDPGSSSDQVTKASLETIEEGRRNLEHMARVVKEACVLPKLTPEPKSDDELDPADLDDADVLFIFRWASGQVGNVLLKGGEVMSEDNLESFHKKPGRRSRIGNGSAKLQPASV